MQLNRSESFKLGHSEIELEPAELDVREQVGGGGFSLVYRALFHGAPVAVKKWFDPDHTAELLADFQEEVEVLTIDVPPPRARTGESMGAHAAASEAAFRAT